MYNLNILYIFAMIEGVFLNWNDRSKGEQFFILMMMCMMAVCFFCLSGFYSSGCETPKFNYESEEEGTAIGCSIPGCGSCDNDCGGESLLCEGCFCAESYKGVFVNSSETSLLGFDERYRLSDCYGCHSERSCYCGYLSDKTEDTPYCGVFYGDTSEDGDERIIGCVDGCFSCVHSSMGGMLLGAVEEDLGID